MERNSQESDVVESSAIAQSQPRKPPQLQEISKRLRRLGNPDGAPSTVSPLRRVKVVGETTAGTMSLLSASIESICADTENNSGSSSSIEKNKNTCSAFQSGGDPRRSSSPGAGVACGLQYHILAVDDSRIDQRVIEKLLKVSSYKVTTVNSALRALEILGLSESSANSFKKVDINLIMTDYCMPEMTGLDLLKRVKAKTSAMKEIPVVVMSSEHDSNRIKRCLDEGAEEFIMKPVQMSDVKRLRGHMVRYPTPTFGSSPTCGKMRGHMVRYPTPTFGSSPTCGKRKG